MQRRDEAPLGSIRVGPVPKVAGGMRRLGAPALAAVLGASLLLAGCVPGARRSIAEPGLRLPWIGAPVNVETQHVDALVDSAEDLIGGDSLKRRGAVRLGAFLLTRFGGDPKAMFDHYARDDQTLENDELWCMLDDAGIGGDASRALIAPVMLDKLEKKGQGDRNGHLTWPEFERAIHWDEITKMKALLTG